MFLDEGADFLLVEARRARPDRELVGDRGGQELVLGLLKDHGDAPEEAAAGPRVRVAALSVSGCYLDGARDGGQQAGEGQGERRLSRAVRADDAGRHPAFNRHIDPAAHGGGRVVSDRQIVRARNRACGRGRRGRLPIPRFRGGQRPGLGGDVIAGKPDAAIAQLPTALLEDLVQGSVGRDPGVGDDDHAINQGRPHVDPVFDDDQGCARALHDRLDGAANLRNAHRVEVRGRLIQEEEARPHRQDGRQREALLLAPRQLRRRMVEGDIQADGVQRVAHARPDVGASHPQVLHAEGHVVADTGQDHLGLGVLHEQADASARTLRSDAVDGERAGGLALLGAPQEPGQAPHEGRLSRAGRTQHEDTLAGRNVEVDAR